MKIGIDANCLVFDRSGFGRYTSSLIRNLLLLDHKNQYFLYASFIRKPKRRKILEDLVKETKAKKVTIKIIPFPARWKEFLTGTPFSLKNLIKEDLDLYFSPHYGGIAKKGFENNIVTIQDLVFMRFPEHRGKKLSRYYLKRTKQAVANSARIIAASESTKKDLIDLLGVVPEKIKVVYLGVGSEFKFHSNQAAIENVVRKYVPPGTKFILSVATLEPRKNLSLIIKAFSLLPHKLKKDYRIVFVGAKGWNNKKLMEIINDYNLTDKIIFTGFVPDEDLPYLYNRASLFVYPSLYEGFGLPPLEAMACGVPVITSNTSSLPEVIGKAGLMIDPQDEGALARAMEKVLTSPSIAKTLSKKGQIQATKFSWEKAALDTLKLFNEKQ